MLNLRNRHIFLAISFVFFLLTSPYLMAASFNYGEALQKSIFFYDMQRLGKITSATGDLANRVYWRGDSFLQDYALPNEEGSIDLGGGFADAGDNPKFNLPMAASTTMLAWSVIEFRAGFSQTNQLTPMLANLRWATDYLLKCWDATHQRLYGQVSPVSVQAEHSNLWMPYEVIDQASIDKNLPRFAYYVDVTHPGTDLAGETVAALTASSIAFQSTDPAYANQLLTAAKAIYQALVNVPNKGKYSDNLGRIANGGWQKADVAAFYNSWSGFNDEVAWSSAWLYRVTQDPTYLATAKQFLPLGNLAATQSWDDKSYGTYLLLAKFAPDSDPIKAQAKASAEGWLNAWSQGTNGHIFSNGGLAIATALSPWGNARYAASTAFGALIYDQYFTVATYDKFAKGQVDYLLGSNPQNFSYMQGFGPASPKRSHHATYEGKWDGNNDVSYPGDNRHISYGALVGGPKDANDTYQDDRNDFIGNEVALDYNAGFVGALAGLVKEYGGTALPSNQFPPTKASENPPKDEIFTNGTVQSANRGSNSTIQVSLLATNHSAWPARVTKNLKVRYFVNLADKPANGTVKVNIFSTDSRAVVSPLTLYDASKQIYYVEVWFKNIPIYPGGDERAISSKETQIQMQYSWDHDYTKDWSYTGLGTQGNYQVAINVPIYNDNQLLFGNEPSAQPQGTLTLNFATTVPTNCIGAKDVLNVGNVGAPSFTIGTTFTSSLPVGGPYAVSLNSTLTPVPVTGGTCKGSLSANSVNVPGTLTANYLFQATPPPDKGTLQVKASATSASQCLSASDKLFIDQDQTGLPFTVGSGISQSVLTGTHQVRLASQTSIPAGNNQTGTCSSTLDQTQVNVQKDQTSLVTATYQYQNQPPPGSCTIVSSKITSQSDWGSQVGIVNVFDIRVNMIGFAFDRKVLDVVFTMKNDFVQNFWTNFGLTTQSFNQNTGHFTGELWSSQLPFSVGGFINNKNPMHIGDNPLTSMVINGVLCTQQ